MCFRERESPSISILGYEPREVGFLGAACTCRRYPSSFLCIFHYPKTSPEFHFISTASLG